MITKSKRAMRTVFYVPLTTTQGQEFLSLCRKYLNKASFKLRTHGRNEHRQALVRQGVKDRLSIRQDVPLANSTYCAVYLDSKQEVSLPLERLQWYESELGSLKEQADELRKSLRAEQVRSSRLCHEINDLFKGRVLLRRELSSYKDLADERYWQLQRIPRWVLFFFGGRS